MSERYKSATAVVTMIIFAALGGLIVMLSPKLSQAATDGSFRDVTIRKICKPKQVVSDKPQLVEKPGGDDVTLVSGGNDVDLNRSSRIEGTAAYSWSPDGSSITYSSNGIYTVDATGENESRIAGPNDDFRNPAWSPDGNTIAFMDHKGNEGNTLIFKDLRTGAIRRSAEFSLLFTHEIQPSWTADSRFLITPAHGPGEQGIFFINRDNGTVSSISTQDEYIYAKGTVSTGGGVLYFWGLDVTSWHRWPVDRDSRFSGYNIFSTQGGGAVTSISNGGSDRGMVLSRDGRRIAYTSDVDEEAWNSDIYLMDIDGSNRVKLTDNGRRNFEPTWSPDGTKIAYVSAGERLSSYDLYWTEATPGSSEHNLTADSDDGNIYNPVWSPDGKRIAFGKIHGNEDDPSEIYRYMLYTMGAPRTEVKVAYSVREGKVCHRALARRQRIPRPRWEKGKKPAKVRTAKVKATNPVRKATSKRPSKRKRNAHRR